MKTKKLTFQNSSGHPLSARLELPVDNKPHVYALFAHCFTCNKNLTAVSNISRALTMEGIAVLRFDFTGLGESEGEFSDTNFSSNVDDLVAAANYLREHYEAPEILIGHSLGGAAVIQAAHLVEDVRAVATIGAPANPQHVQHLLQSSIDEIKTNGEAVVQLAGRNFKIKKQFLDDLEEGIMRHHVSDLKSALLVMHAPQDSIVGINNAAEIYQSARHPKSFVSLDGADHLMSDPADSQYAGNIIASWSSRYTSTPSGESLETNKQVVVKTSEEGYTTQIKAGNHYLIADEPKSVGGSDLGPSPYGYLLSALGACTSMTLRMYADRKEWPLQEVEVHLSHQKIHAEDCSDCESEKGFVDLIQREIKVFGPLDETQKARLMEIADRCPVHKTLHNEIKVKTTLIDN